MASHVSIALMFERAIAFNMASARRSRSWRRSSTVEFEGREQRLPRLIKEAEDRLSRVRREHSWALRAQRYANVVRNFG